MVHGRAKVSGFDNPGRSETADGLKTARGRSVRKNLTFNSVPASSSMSGSEFVPGSARCEVNHGAGAS